MDSEECKDWIHGIQGNQRIGFVDTGHWTLETGHWTLGSGVWTGVQRRDGNWTLDT